MDKLQLGVNFPQQFRRLQAMLLGIFFKIHIMEQSHKTPKMNILSQFLGKISHTSLYRQSMKNMKRLPVVFSQQLQGLISCNICMHSRSFLPVFAPPGFRRGCFTL